MTMIGRDDAPASPKKNRPRAPTITVDTSALNEDGYEAPIVSSPVASQPMEQNTTSLLAIPQTVRARADSQDSISSVGSHTIIGSEKSGHSRSASMSSAPFVWNDEEALRPDPGKEKDFQVENNPFALTPGIMTLLESKNFAAFHAVRGLSGLAKGLRTDVQTGLSVDEDHLSGSVPFESIIDVAIKDEPSATIETSALKARDSDTTLGNTNENKGFSDRKRVFGDNRIPERKSKNFFQLAWMALQDKVLILLSIAAVISLALGLYQTFGTAHEDGGARVEWVEGVAIIVAIAIVVIVGALNDWQKERQFVKLNRKKEDRYVQVIRSGRTLKISVYDVLVGDIMMCEQGDILPVDGIFINGHGVACDESSATGESDIMKKTPADVVLKAMEENKDIKKMDPFMVSGAKVSEGYGTFLVTSVGMNSSYGKTMMALRDDGEITPLQLKLNILAGYIAKLGSAAGLLLFTVLLIEFLSRLSGDTRSPQDKAQDFLNILIVSVTVVVVAVPEGLPLAVTLALAFATKRMTKDNNLVRHLQSCETMGNATVICSDKTGTLTQNVMTVVGGSIGAHPVAFGSESMTQRLADALSADASSPESQTTKSTHLEKRVLLPEIAKSINADVAKLLLQSIAINSTAFLGEEEGKSVFIGSKTETALLDLGQNCLGMTDLALERSNNPAVQLFPFDSRYKCMGAVIKTGSGYRMFIKGAPEIVLTYCTQILEDATNGISGTALTETFTNDLKHEISSYASLSLRTIALAFRDFPTWPPPKSTSENPKEADFVNVRNDLTWIGVVGIQDPVRAGVPQAVKDCRRAGVNVKMVTGDNVETARAIATEIGILTEDGLVMEGPAFRKLDDLQRRQIVSRLSVLARSSPEDKQVLVKTLRALGNVVAVTGDGTNDAQALKAADVGFSMGIAGTEVAKEASDIILMDDNFSSIVKALAWGRTVNDAVKKFLQFQLTVNITAVVLTFITAVSSSSGRSVLNAVQLLWVNLIMDTFAALALATDPPTSSLLDRKPEPRNRPLIDLIMWKMIIGQAIFQLVVTFVLYFAGPNFLPYPPNELATLVFNTFVWMQIFGAVNSRRIDNKLNTLEGIHRNVWFIGILAIMIGGQTLIVFVGGAAFGVTAQTGPQWAIAIVIGVLALPVGVLIRLFPDAWIRAIGDKIIPQFVVDHYARKRAAEDIPQPGSDDYLYYERMVMIRDDLSWFRRFHGGRITQFSRANRKIAELKFAALHPKEAWVETRRSRSRSESRSPMRSVIAMSGSMAGSIAVGGVVPPAATTPTGSAAGSVKGSGHSREVSRDLTSSHHQGTSGASSIAGGSIQTTPERKSKRSSLDFMSRRKEKAMVAEKSPTVPGSSSSVVVAERDAGSIV